MRRIFTILVATFVLLSAPALSCFIVGVFCQTLACLVSVSQVQGVKESQPLSAAFRLIAHQAWERSWKSLWDWNFWQVPSFQTSWLQNRDLLSEVPASSEEEKKLICFLQQRWLAKMSGFYPFEINWLCPFFGIRVQAHPETTNCYARDPSRAFSKTYKAKMEAWKKDLPHPHGFPLILTRPADIHEYLPNCWTLPSEITIEALIEQIQVGPPFQGMRCVGKPLVLDLTNLLPVHGEKWLACWKSLRLSFEEVSKKHEIICIQRLQRDGMGAIRILPLESPFSQKLRKSYRWLSDWVSCFGLTASKVELDRSFLKIDLIPNVTQKLDFRPSQSLGVGQSQLARISNTDGVVIAPTPKAFTAVQNQFLSHIGSIPDLMHPKDASLKKDEFLSYLYFFEKAWVSSHPQKNLMVKATVVLLKNLIDREVNWEAVGTSFTKRAIANVAFLEIQRQMNQLLHESASASFFDVALCIEQIHSSLSALLEISLPFSVIHEGLDAPISNSLKPLTHFAVHASAMTSLAGVLKVAQMQAGVDFRVLYGENSYFEAIQAAQLASNAVCVLEATEEDWKKADLILAQFNPVLKRDDSPISEYKLERTIERLRQIFEMRQKKPLILVIDSTIDFIDSVRMRQTLELFKKEIEEGILNVVCFRSGLKFDLFGMDHCSGSPFWMIHASNQRWEGFQRLLTDSALQTDLLSFNWFCLAYKHAAPELDLYRKQIFANTRALLDQIPSTFYDPASSFRVIPMEEGVDPAFIEMKVSGSFHAFKASTILGGCLYLRCLHKGMPIFCRRSIGFFHANFGLLFGEKSSSMRLTVGLDPAENEILSDCFNVISKL